MASEVGMTERRYKILRNHLDELGYRQPLVIDSLPLVERLVSDLLHTTESLRHYKELAQQSLQERCYFENGAEPYKQDNAKLVIECNELHLKVLNQKEEAEKTKKELKLQIRKLESENSDLKFLSNQHLLQVKTLEKESAEKSRKIVHLQGKNLQTTVITPGGKKKTFPAQRSTLEIDTPLKASKPWKERYWSVCAQAKDPYIANMMDCCNQRCVKLSREVTELREEHLQQSEIIATLKTQLQNRDKEINRLCTMLEGGRPLSAIAKDCCYKDADKRLSNLTNDVKQMEKTNKELEIQLKESVADQHEAMTRAVRLAERNKQLEQELRDIDHMALAVEAECNSTVKENTKRVSKIQEKLETSLMQIHGLEREVLELKRTNQEQQAELHGCRKDKLNIQKTLEIMIQEKKNMLDRIKNFTLIEHDLMKEIDRLTQINTLQKRRINELESKQLSKDTAATVPDRLGSRRTSPCKSRRVSKGSKNVGGSSQNGVHKGTMFMEQEQEDLPLELLEKQREEYYVQDNGKRNELLDRIQAERDYYCKEYHNLKDQLNNIPDHPHPDNNLELRCKLNEKEQELICLAQQIRDLTRDKQNMQARIDAFQDREMRDSMTSPFGEGAGYSVKAVMKRLERERDLARADIGRLEEERDALRQRLKNATGTQVTEHARLEKTVLESEERVRKLEAERRELLTSQGVHKATINNIEDQIDSCREQLHAAQSELSQQRTLYNQIKTLQQQTDHALSDCQSQLTQAELELANAQERVRNLERDRAALDREVASLKNDRTILRGNLAQMDQDKDGLLISVDNKTERIAAMEQELKGKENLIFNLENAVTELQKKLDITLDEHGAKEQAVRSAERDTEALRKEVATIQRARDSALSDNRRLQDDLASVMQDCRVANSELGMAHEEVQTLKRQLQEYVSDIRRIEELLARKECERGEMLEQFRGLSMEATVLETNNHSLESEAQENKTQLCMAQDRIVDLEQQLEVRDTLVRSYEVQIADLTAQIASLESQLQHHSEQKRCLEADLNAVRDLCVKLDSQKDLLQQQTTDGDVMRRHLENDLARLREEQDMLQTHLVKDRATIDTLEGLLAECQHETENEMCLKKELYAEVKSLRYRVDELQTKLDIDAAELRRCQIQASEYSQQVSDLQRQLTNERFERARAADEHRSSEQVVVRMKPPTHPVKPFLHSIIIEPYLEKNDKQPQKTSQKGEAETKLLDKNLMKDEDVKVKGKQLQPITEKHEEKMLKEERDSSKEEIENKKVITLSDSESDFSKTTQLLKQTLSEVLHVTESFTSAVSRSELEEEESAVKKVDGN